MLLLTYVCFHICALMRVCARALTMLTHTPAHSYPSHVFGSRMCALIFVFSAVCSQCAASFVLWRRLRCGTWHIHPCSFTQRCLGPLAGNVFCELGVPCFHVTKCHPVFWPTMFTYFVDLAHAQFIDHTCAGTQFRRVHVLDVWYCYVLCVHILVGCWFPIRNTYGS